MTYKINDGGPAFASLAVGPQGDVHGDWGMSLRAYAAITLRVPDSGIDWLDDMIRQAKRDDFAGQALAGICANSYTPWAPEAADISDEVLAQSAYDLADAMLKARTKP